MSTANNPVITDEMRRRIEENRRNALEKLKLKNPNFVNKLQLQYDSPKAKSSKDIKSTNRGAPYVKSTNLHPGNIVNNNNIYSVQQNAGSSMEMPVNKLKCVVELIGSDRFTLRVMGTPKHPAYRKLMAEYLKINSRANSKLTLINSTHH
jgi:hypothetical protein